MADDISDSANDAKSEHGPPPQGSRAISERFADGVTIQLPPVGIAGTRGLFLLAALWNGFLGALSPALLLPLLAGKNKQPDKVGVLLLVLGIFWCVGIGILLVAIHTARRRAVFAVTHGMLLVLQSGLFGSKQRDYKPGEVLDIRVGPSGMTVNDQPVLELQIMDGKAKKLGLLAGRPEAELAWVADELKLALRSSQAGSRGDAVKEW